MQDVSVVIVGGGLSGLYAAFLLEQKGIDYVLLEARDRLGGRIAVAPSPINKASVNKASINELLADKALDSSAAHNEKSNSAFDLGPSWFWPDYQPQLSGLIDELNLARFAQFEDGDMMVERAPNQPAVRTQGYRSSPPSMRLVGGMASLIDALYARLDATRIVTGQTVKRLTKKDHCIEIESEGSSTHIKANQLTTYQAQHVLLALPPRLAAANIVFEPSLPQDLAKEWQTTATWMAPHAKYVAVYDTAFWRNQGLSGSARSAVGPLTEIHDASAHNSSSYENSLADTSLADTSLAEGKGALFGFFGVAAHVRQSVSESELKAHCRVQLVRLFGAQANSPSAEYIKDWAQDPLTAIPADVNGAGQHAIAPTARPNAGVWQDGLTGSGSEWSIAFPGYIAGAIDAANKAVQGLPDSIWSSSVSVSVSVSSPNRIVDE